MKQKIIILSYITSLIFIIYVVYILFKKSKAPKKIDLTSEVLNTGTLSDTELTNLVNISHEKINGITFLGEEELLNSYLNLSDIDLIRAYNRYIELFNTSLYSDLSSEWWFSANVDLWNALKQKFIYLHINQ